MTEKSSVLVDGAAAARTAEQLRRADYTGPIIIGNEVYLPYNQLPLSKDVDDVALHTT